MSWRGGMDSRKTVVVAVSFWIGIGFQEHLIFDHLVTGPWEALLGNTVTSGSIVAAILIAFFELTSPRRRRLEVELDPASLPQIHEFLRGFASRMGWNEGSTDRLCLVGEEMLGIMLRFEEPDKQRVLKISAHYDGAAELEFVSGYDEDNLEDRLAHIAEQTEIMDEREISFRLLRYYASSVRHQKYHDVDVITVQVEGTSA